MSEAPAFLDDMEHDAPAPPSDKLRELSRLAARLVLLLETQSAIEVELSEVALEIDELTRRQIPELMSELGVESVGVEGQVVKLKTWYKAVLPKDPQERRAAMKWLREHDAGDLAKSEVAVSFGRNEDNLAQSVAGHLEEFLEEQGVEREVRQTVDIHHATYTAWVKERLEDGETLPLELLGARTGRIAEIADKRRK